MESFLLAILLICSAANVINGQQPVACVDPTNYSSGCQGTNPSYYYHIPGNCNAFAQCPLGYTQPQVQHCAAGLEWKQTHVAGGGIYGYCSFQSDTCGGCSPPPPPCSLTPSGPWDIEINLTDGTTQGNIDWVVQLAAGTGANICNLQGVIKLDFNPIYNIQSADIELDIIATKSGFVFNLGDSRTNNAFGGDSSTQFYDAEVFARNNYMGISANDLLGGQIVESWSDFLPANTAITVHLNVANNHIAWDNHNGICGEINNQTMFALDGRQDAQGPSNYDIYLGMNRVINGGRLGYGLCNARVKFNQ